MEASLWQFAALMWICCALAAASDQKPLSSQELDALENMCDLQTLAESMYCYCDHLEKDDATNSNCWVYGDTKPNDTLWDTFHHQKHLHRLTINLRGDGSLTFVPSRILTYTPQLWLLEIRNAAIERVRSEAFSGSESVAELQLTNNGIAHLGKHAFNDLTNLTRLNIGKNKVVSLGRHVFRNLPKLKLLFLDRNEIGHIRNGAFSGLDALEVLELYDNRLDEISQGTFRGLKQLERLDLHRNLLETIEDRTFAAMPNLRDLDLEENRIKYISEKGLSGLNNLQRLNLHDNKLLSILPGTFLETPGLFFLNIHQNVLDTLDEKAFAPIMGNLKNITMYLFIQENVLHCDCRLAWLLRLRTETASTQVQAALDKAVCHMEGGTLPPRLQQAGPTADPALETSTLGIGPPVRLVDLKVGEGEITRRLMDWKVHELPCDRPLAEAPDVGNKQTHQLSPEEQLQKQHLQQHQQQLERRQSQKQQLGETPDVRHQKQQDEAQPQSPPAGAPVRRNDPEAVQDGGSLAAACDWLLVLAAAVATVTAAR